MLKKALLLALAPFLLCRFTTAQELVFTPDMSQQTIQTQINSTTKYKKIVFSPGIYTKISTLSVNPSLVSSVYSHGAKFIFPASQGKFGRLFNILWNNMAESPSIIFDGGEFDMNEQNQGTVGLNKEQQAAIFIDGQSVGKINVTLRDITIRNSAGDGISIYRNSAVSVVGCKTNECLRGGLTVCGPGNEVVVDDLDARGNKFRSGIRIEPSGYAQRQVPALYTLNNIRMNWFDFHLGKGSLISLTNSAVEPINPLIAPDGFQGYVYNEGGKLVIDNCLFYSNRLINLQLVGNTRISNTEFKLCRYDESDRQDVVTPIMLRWYYSPAGEFNKNQTFVLDNCDFSIYNVDLNLSKCIGFCTFATHPYSGEKNFIVVKNNRFQDTVWNSLWRFQDAVTKTRLISQDNMLGDIYMENKR